MRTIAVVNQKGGCGKTTVSINLANALAETGQRTLLVDMDPQSHCAVGLAVPEEQVEQSIYDVLISSESREPVRLVDILWQINERLELAPSNIDLSAFEQQMAGIAGRECCLKDAIEEVDGEFDFVVIDCPPAVGLLTFSALRASTDVIIPVETGYFALHGLSKQLETLSILCERCNHSVDVHILASMYDIRTKMAREILAELRSHFADKMFSTVVNFNTKLKEAASLGQPIGEYAPASRGQTDFRLLAEEIVASAARHQHREIVNSLSGRLEQISSSADELLKVVNPATELAETIELKEVAELPESETIERSFSQLDGKLSDYYGVNQLGDAVAFVTLYPRAQKVCIAGDFNGWQPEKTPMEKVGDSGVWQAKLQLPSGRHHYRLVVDDQWQQDPYNAVTELNPYGDFNSVVEVN